MQRVIKNKPLHFVSGSSIFDQVPGDLLEEPYIYLKLETFDSKLIPTPNTLNHKLWLSLLILRAEGPGLVYWPVGPVGSCGFGFEIRGLLVKITTMVEKSYPFF